MEPSGSKAARDRSEALKAKELKAKGSTSKDSSVKEKKAKGKQGHAPGPLELIDNLKVLGRIRRDWSFIPSHGELINELFLPMKSPICLPGTAMVAGKPTFNGLDFNKFLHKNREYGLVINLSVSEYYRPESVTEASCEYVHFPVQCYSDVIPDEASFDKFKKIVDKYLDKHPKKRIILTSTMGLNRCAFFIAEYFADDMNRFECLKQFVKSRPPHILRLFSVSSYLKKEYGEELKKEHYMFMTKIVAETHNSELRQFNVLAKY